MTQSVISNGQPPQGVWPSLAPYVVPPLAASIAIVPAFPLMIARGAEQRGMIPAFSNRVAKNAEQKGLPSLRITVMGGLKEGIKTAPTVGVIVGTQMILQSTIEKTFLGDEDKGSFKSMVVSSAVVGTISAPILAIFNAQTIKEQSIKKESSIARLFVQPLRNFSSKQCLAIIVQETAFVGGFSSAGPLSSLVKEKFGDNKAVGYSATFIAGALGSLCGHPANTSLTRWQSAMKIDGFHQLLWGASKRAYGVGLFAVGYKWTTELLHPKNSQ